MRCANLALLATLGMILGCGGEGPFEYVPVSGRLTYEDGAPVPASSIRLQFVAQDAQPVGNARPRPAMALLNAAGEFDCVTSYKYGDGLIPGSHKVIVDMAVDDKGELLVPAEYTQIGTTPLVVSTDDAPLEIKIPRP